jgi:hypothetical protein
MSLPVKNEYREDDLAEPAKGIVPNPTVLSQPEHCVVSPISDMCCSDTIHVESLGLIHVILYA